MPKLTISMETEIIEQAKKLARRNRTTVSGMFARFVRAQAQRGVERPPLGPGARAATGIVKWPRGRLEREVLQEALIRKHGGKK